MVVKAKSGNWYGGVQMNGDVIESKLSKIAKRTTANIIRELLKATSIPGLISFGGGVPDPETFPRAELAEIAREIVLEEYQITLQYGTTEGDPLLKQQYLEYLKRHENIHGLSDDQIVITSGSQQALDLIGRMFLDEDSICAIVDPVYLGAASAFRIRAPKFINLPMEPDGPNLQILENSLEKMSTDELERFKFLYVVSNFDNPTGLTLSLEKRHHILDIAEKYKIPVIEDDPYGLLRFEGEKIPTIYHLAQQRGLQEQVLLLNTFSKVLSPGLRMGMVIGNRHVVRKIVMGKQAADLCTSPLLQRLTARYLERHDPLKVLQNSLKVYAAKRDVMLESFEKHLIHFEGTTWTNPCGGLFTWVCLPKHIDTVELLEYAKERKVIFIPGSAFSVDGKSNGNCMRLSFCLPSEAEIQEGVVRLADAIDAYQKENGD